MKKRFLLTSVYFLITLAVVYSVFFNVNQTSYSNTENRTLTTLESMNNVNISDFLSGSFQSTFKSLISDQFPAKKTINTIYLNADKQASDLISKISSKFTISLMPVGTAYRIGDSDYYISDIVEKTDEYDTLFNNRIWNYERIYEKYGDKYKMYIYKPSAAEEMDWFDSAILKSSGREYWNEFVQRLGSTYKVKEQKLDTLDDYMDQHYKTDHHWNYKGAYIGYTDIINMIAEDNDDVTKPYEMTGVIVHSEPFYGSTSLHNEKSLGYDQFVTYSLDYEKNYTIYINGVRVDSLGEKDEVFSDPEAYMYEGYYGYNEEIIKIVNNNCGNNKTLLVFGDSFSNCINEDIAAHFKTTFIIDTRFIYEDDASNTTFSLDDFLAENEVDCILWLQFYTSLYFDSTCYLHIDLDY